VRIGQISRVRSSLRQISSQHSIFRKTSISLTSGLVDPSVVAPDSVFDLVKLYFRMSWLSWWAQIVLSVISGVILTFANTVRTGSVTSTYIWTSGFAFSSVGVLLAFVNSFWTWNVTRLCRRIDLGKVDVRNIIPSLRKYSHYSVAFSFMGMLFSLLGAEQIVGTLAAKLLSANGYSPLLAVGAVGQSVAPFQAVDIFLVQANTNALFSHFASLLCYILLQTQLPVPVPVL
jgi:hypothetical protein